MTHTNNPTEQQATPTSEEELDEILAKHGAEAGELTASLKDALLAWRDAAVVEALEPKVISCIRQVACPTCNWNLVFVCNHEFVIESRHLFPDEINKFPVAPHKEKGNQDE